MSKARDGERLRLESAYRAREQRGVQYDALSPAQAEFLSDRICAWTGLLWRVKHRPQRVLEVGAGTGAPSRWAVEVGASSVVAADVQRERLRQAHVINPRVACAVADGRALPFRSRSFDTVLMSLVLSSILADDVRSEVTHEVERVLAADGVVLCFDFRVSPPLNRDVRGVTKREFLRLFPGMTPTFASCSLAPPLARRLQQRRRTRRMLEAVPLLRTHMAALMRREPSLRHGGGEG